VKVVPSRLKAKKAQIEGEGEGKPWGEKRRLEFPPDLRNKKILPRVMLIGLSERLQLLEDPIALHHRMIEEPYDQREASRDSPIEEMGLPLKNVDPFFHRICTSIFYQNGTQLRQSVIR